MLLTSNIGGGFGSPHSRQGSSAAAPLQAMFSASACIHAHAAEPDPSGRSGGMPESFVQIRSSYRPKGQFWAGDLHEGSHPDSFGPVICTKDPDRT